MKQYIDKSALIAEIKRITDEQQEICKADVALGKAPDSKNIEVIYQFQQFTKFLDTLEVKEIGVDIGSPEDDYNSKTIQFIDADGNIKEITFNKAQNGKSALETAKEEKVDNQNCVKPADKVEPKFKVGDEIKTANEESLTITKIDEKGYWSEDLFICGFEEECIWNLVEQKPAEWSEEDKAIIEALNDYVKNLDILFSEIKIGDRDISSKEFREKVQSWLKSLEGRVQPKQEWSEEDRKRIQRISNFIWKNRKGDTDDIYQQEQDVKWLKSLRLQNNITDEELAQAKKDVYNDVLNKIEYHSSEPTFDDGWSAAIWYLKKRNAMPQNRWKPSDEQIKALDAILVYNPPRSNESRNHLITLYNELKKLRGEINYE